MNKHELRSRRKKLSILNATINLVATQPMEYITIDKIRKAAKVSQVTIYKHFQTKDNLINTAIKEFAGKAVDTVVEMLNSNVGSKERLEGYFRTSFNIALLYPSQREIIEYVFSGINPELTEYVSTIYHGTYPALERLYNDSRKDGVVRSEISFEQFLKMCDMFTRIQPQFYQTKEEMDLLLESIVRSFG